MSSQHRHNNQARGGENELHRLISQLQQWPSGTMPFLSVEDVTRSIRTNEYFDQLRESMVTVKLSTRAIIDSDVVLLERLNVVNSQNTKDEDETEKRANIRRMWLDIFGPNSATVPVPRTLNEEDTDEDEDDDLDGYSDLSYDEDDVKPPNTASRRQAKRAFIRRMLAIRSRYDDGVQEMNMEFNRQADRIRNNFSRQAEIRPITQTDTENMLCGVRQKFANVELELQLSVCNEGLLARQEFIKSQTRAPVFDARATQILKNYFSAHIERPYPNEQEKIALAEQCSLSVQQVSNWFGNQRIRYKKTLQQGGKKQRGDDEKRSMH